jgi:hypothetical protein
MAASEHCAERTSVFTSRLSRYAQAAISPGCMTTFTTRSRFFIGLLLEAIGGCQPFCVSQGKRRVQRPVQPEFPLSSSNETATIARIPRFHERSRQTSRWGRIDLDQRRLRRFHHAVNGMIARHRANFP